MFERLNIEGFRKHIAGVSVPREMACVFVHHTAGLRKHWNGRSSVVATHNYHRDVRGWWGLGYNFMIDCNEPDTIWVGRPLSRTGAHALIEPYAATAGARWAGYSRTYPNVHGIGVCIPGSYNKDVVDPECYRTLAQTVAIICKRFGIEDTHIGYHEEVANKCCPGGRYNFPKRRDFVELVESFMDGNFGNAKFQMNEDAPVPATILGGVSFISRDEADRIADRYNLSPFRDSLREVPIRAFLQQNSLPDPGFDPSRKLITAHTPEHWSNVKLVINDKVAGRVWMRDNGGAALLEDITKHSGWPTNKLPVTDGKWVMLRDLEKMYPINVILSTEYWTTHRKVYLYMDGASFCARESLEGHEITEDPSQHT
jgi:N-acetylmuramoyl-L-alanine amidase